MYSHSRENSPRRIVIHTGQPGLDIKTEPPQHWQKYRRNFPTPGNSQLALSDCAWMAYIPPDGRRFMPRNKEPDPHKTEDSIVDEPGMEERFQRALRKALNTPPKHRSAPTLKPKERPPSKGRVHK